MEYPRYGYLLLHGLLKREGLVKNKKRTSHYVSLVVQLASGRRFRVLNVVDDFSREMVGQLVSVSISGQQVSRFLSQLIEERRKPEHIVCDNGCHRQCKTDPLTAI